MNMYSYTLTPSMTSVERLHATPKGCNGHPGLFMSESNHRDGFSFSRRSFLKTFSTTAAAAATARIDAVAQELAKANTEKTYGPDAVPVTLNVNGKQLKLQLEPRVTLLEALRNHSNLTGAKE